MQHPVDAVNPAQVLVRNHVTVTGQGEQALVFAHGFGCDQQMWRLVAPAFEATHRIVLFDYVGAGNSDKKAYNPIRYNSLNGYVADLLEVCQALHLRKVVFVGHSVSAMVGLLAAIKSPELFDKLVLVGPSPCYINDQDYPGGFSREDIEELLDSLESNYLGWSDAMAPVIMGNPDQPQLGTELATSFCRVDPEIAKQFARVTFLSDCRVELAKLQIPTLILQCSQDVIAPLAVGRYVHEQINRSRFHLLQATGHCPHVSAPQETIQAIRSFL